MKFLSTIWLPAWGLFILMGVLGDANGHANGTSAIGAIALFWLWLNIPITIVYAVVRIFRRASRDAAQP